MNLFEKLRLLADWSPLLGYVQVISADGTVEVKAQAVVDALQFAATKSPTAFDDELLGHVEAILRSEEGKAAFAWAVAKMTKEEPGE